VVTQQPLSRKGAAALWALEELRKARIKCQNSRHEVVSPCLMTFIWLKQLYKAAADIIFVWSSCLAYSSVSV
jgi:hypothetical protein